ncbi:MAG: BatA domain-containing protein [Candidatus Zixiibacteriota bacterium]
MFSFLNSAMLIAGATAVIPLLIHLFSRRKMRVITFSSLRYLQAMQKRQVRRIKIRQLLLLALRTIILALAALAFARPVTKSGYLGSQAGVSAVILFDRSASMSQESTDGPLFELAQARALGVVSAFSEADEVALVTFGSGGPAQPPEFSSPKRAAEILRELAAADGRGEMERALSAAYELFGKAKHFNRELFIVSDFQANSLPDTLLRLADRAGDAGGDIRVYALGVGPADPSSPGRPRNAGIVRVDFGGQLIEAGVDFTTGYMVKNYDDDAKNDLITSLFIDGQRVAQSDFSLNGREEKRLTFTRTVDSPGRHFAQVRLSDDDFPGDNQFNFTFDIPETFNLLIVNNDAGGEFIQLALEPTDVGVRHWLIKRINASRLGSVRLDDYDVIALVGLNELTRSEEASLSRFVRRGGGALFIPGPGLTPASFATGLADFTSLRFDRPIAINPPGSGHFTLQSLDFSHPIFHPFAELYEEGLPAIEFYSLPKFELSAETRALASFSGEHPALIERKLGRGKVLTFASLLNPTYSTVARHSFFVPFVIRLAEYAGSDLSRYDYRRHVGDEASAPLPRRVSPNESLTLVGPSGVRQVLQARETQGAYQIDLPPLSRAGIYELKSRSGTFERLAVNVDPAEGDLRALDLDETVGLLGVDISAVPGQTQVAGFLAEKRTGKELWKTLLWLVALGLLLETALAGDLFGKKTEPEN